MRRFSPTSGLLFAIGVAVGLARENHGAAGLASVVAYLVATRGAEVLIAVPPEALADVSGRARELAVAAYKAHELSKLSVPVGILSGLMSGALYNRFYNIELPSYLSFFGGRRFVPIASGFAALLLAVAFGTQWQHLEHGMDALSRSVLHAGAFGLFAYGVLNRVLIVTGLHHIINNIAWFLLGDYHGVTGDLKRFFAGDPSAGAFMSGFFPVMMFGLPAACLAMYHSALPERRRAVGGLLGSIALTSILTGVTEPIEFTFIFLAPALYAVHALLTGTAFIIMNALHVRLGFGFSAGLFDYVLNFSRATRPLWLLPVGAGYFALYYGAVPLRDRALRSEDPGPRCAASGSRRRPPPRRPSVPGPGSRPSAAPRISGPWMPARRACALRRRSVCGRHRRAEAARGARRGAARGRCAAGGGGYDRRPARRRDPRCAAQYAAAEPRRRGQRRRQRVPPPSCRRRERAAAGCRRRMVGRCAGPAGRARRARQRAHRGELPPAGCVSVLAMPHSSSARRCAGSGCARWPCPSPVMCT